MSTTALIVIIVVVVIVVLLLGLFFASRRRAAQRSEEQRERSREEFGSEYERMAQERGSEEEAERELRERRARVERMVEPLSEESRGRYEEQWEEVERVFVDNPQRSIEMADRTVSDILDERNFVSDAGQSDEETERGLAAMHPEIADDYRRAAPKRIARLPKRLRGSADYRPPVGVLCQELGTLRPSGSGPPAVQSLPSWRDLRDSASLPDPFGEEVRQAGSRKDP